jgi:hypothetical protein
MRKMREIDITTGERHFTLINCEAESQRPVDGMFEVRPPATLAEL